MNIYYKHINTITCEQYTQTYSYYNNISVTILPNIIYLLI